MNNSSPPPFDQAQIEPQCAALRNAIAELIITWSHLESGLSCLLAKILQDPTVAFASAIYFSPASADVRIKIVDSALDVLAQQTDSYDQIMDCWRRTLSRINRAKAVRNTVAHGVIGFSATKTRWHVRLTAPPFDFKRNAPSSRNGQLSGMSTNDLTQATKSLKETADEVGLIIMIVGAVYDRDLQALQDTLLELEGHRLKATPPKVVQKPAKRKRQT
jgi:hypothetical protein